MKYNFIYTFTPALGRFFHGSRSVSGFFRVGYGNLADPDADSGKKSLIRIREKIPGSETLLLSKIGKEQKLNFFNVLDSYPLSVRIRISCPFRRLQTKFYCGPASLRFCVFKSSSSFAHYN